MPSYEEPNVNYPPNFYIGTKDDKCASTTKTTQLTTTVHLETPAQSVASNIWIDRGYFEVYEGLIPENNPINMN